MPSTVDKQLILMDELEAEFASSVIGLQDDLLDSIEKMLKDFDRKGGRFVGDERATTLIMSLKKELKNIIDKSDYSTSVDKLLLGFDNIETNVKAIQKEWNSIKLKDTLINPYKKVAVSEVADNLLGANVDVRFINPIKKMLYNHVNMGGSVLETEKQLRIMIVGQKGEHGMLQKWTGQVARDGMQQYEGNINQKIKKEFDLNATEYVGSLVADSRSQCKRWVAMQRILDSKLQQEINWAKKNGSGFIMSTTVETFLINRGGYNCRHTGIPVRV